MYKYIIYILFILVLYLTYTHYFSKSNEYFINNNYINPINIYDNFLSNDECDKLIKMSDGRFTDASIYTNSDSIVNKDSRSSTYVGFNKSENSLIKNIEDRVATLLNIDITQIEPLQISRYEKGQQYKQHYDFFDIYNNESSNQREYSIIVYLNDLEIKDGGSTFFPIYKLKLYPYKGRAIQWVNTFKNNKENEKSLHCGEPILSNTIKYILTIWTRQRSLK
jgi:prolyl 4-hydroxylase